MKICGLKVVVGVVGMVVADITFEQNFCCGVVTMHLGRSGDINYRWGKIPSEQV